MTKSPSAKRQATADVLRSRAREAQAKAQALDYIADLDLSSEVAELDHATDAEHRLTERIARAREELALARDRVAAAEAAIRSRVTRATAVPGVSPPMVAEVLGIPLRLCVPATSGVENTGVENTGVENTGVENTGVEGHAIAPGSEPVLSEASS